MIGDLKLALLNKAGPSSTHRFLKQLSDLGKLKRVYTQNIDDLETAAGLERVSHSVDAKDKLNHKKVVQLHGHLRDLFCGVCHHVIPFTKKQASIFAKDKRDIPCPSCEKLNAKRRAKGKRLRPIGKLQTFVVLQNGGPNPDGEIADSLYSPC